MTALHHWLAFAGLRNPTLADLRERGLPWFVDALAQREPAVLSGPATDRTLTMCHAFAAELACLRERRPEQPGDLDVIADTLVMRGSWLGEPLALWLLGEVDAALELFVERLPVLPEFAEWSRIDAQHTFTVTLDDGTVQTMTFTAGHNSLADIVDSINAQLVGATARVEGGAITISHDSTSSLLAVANAAADRRAAEPEPERPAWRSEPGWQDRSRGSRGRRARRW